MGMRSRWSWCLLALVAAMGSPRGVRGGQDDMGMGMTVRNVADMQLVPIPGFPTCGPAAVQTGDPTMGPSIIYGKLEAGCVVPWHWHTPNEHLMIVSGEAVLEMKGGEPRKLEAGAFALMPSKHAHQFRCTTTCTLYVYSDTAFDIHYVDGQGRELTPEAALAAVHEKTTAPPPAMKP